MKKLWQTLGSKLILSFLMVALVTVLVAFALISLTSEQSLMNLVTDQQSAQLKQVVLSYYESAESLDGFFEYYVGSRTDNPDNPPPNPNKNSGSDGIRGVRGLVDSDHRALIPMAAFDVGQKLPPDMMSQAIPVEVDDEAIAYILPDTSHAFQLSLEEQRYLERSTLAIGLAALAGILTSVAMSFLLTGQLLRPIRQLTRASKALAMGDLEQQIPVTSQDELGELTATFNQMSADLARTDQQRKRMTADITHDLSTPIQIISGYIEMLESNQERLFPQRIDIIKTELDHLRQLVNDLTTLSQIEGGGLEMQLESVDPSGLLERTYLTYQSIAESEEVELVLEVPEGSAPILVDEGRMMQVLKNLVDNALRYTSRGGRITLKAICGDQVQLCVIDDGAGIARDDLPFVFDRFYRADRARGANSGKMGLGLAICKALISAQGGSIKAESAGKGQGTTITITFDVQALLNAYEII